MSKSKHTEGPWKASYNRKFGNYQIWAGDFWIANTKCEACPVDHEANALLIAAGPDLLAALEMLLNRTANPITDHAFYTLEDARKAARAAIAKAEPWSQESAK